LISIDFFDCQIDIDIETGICFIGGAETIDEEALNSFNRAFSSKQRICLSGSNKTG